MAINNRGMALDSETPRKSPLQSRDQTASPTIVAARCGLPVVTDSAGHSTHCVKFLPNTIFPASYYEEMEGRKAALGQSQEEVLGEIKEAKDTFFTYNVQFSVRFWI